MFETSKCLGMDERMTGWMMDFDHGPFVRNQEQNTRITLAAKINNGETNRKRNPVNPVEVWDAKNMFLW